MSQTNLVSFVIPEDTLKKVKENLVEIIALLTPYLIGLSVEERQNVLKMGDKTIPFVQKVSDYCKLNPDFVPNFLDVNEMQKDLMAASQLDELLKMVNSLRGNLDDTVMLCGSEAYTASLFYYNSVVYAARKNNPSARPIAYDLSERYPGRKKAKQKV
ncbi:MAG: hypothetical protein JNM88_14015 [Chitinophagaceae bacterium]|nr:hypothetical protein [Chitinophagaceae bacterium]